ncbi:YdcF family protein [Candidatus Kaiserbacteria bacterium]|nr:YdcF family protein [Candidatus Kaiserbacteria bacterium]
MSRTRVLFRWTLVVIPLGLAGAIVIPLLIRMSVREAMYNVLSDVPRSEVAMILGASVSRGQPSRVLATRTDAAIALYRNGTVSKILVTGDNSALSHDEVTPVRKYLIDAGIPARDIFLDHAGFDTYSSMYRARDVFGVRSLVIVTQDFHMPRSLFIARHLELDAQGFIPEGSGGDLRSYMREIPASLKALFDLARDRKPKYLGDPIPIGGDGSTTWY